MGIANRKGTIGSGKYEDFVLPENNPLIDIRNTRTIQAVFLKNRYFNRQALDKVLDEAAAIASVTQRDE